MRGLEVDLTGNLVFTDAQLDKRAADLIWSKVPLQDEQKLSAVLHGQALGTFQPSPDHLAQVQAYQAWRLEVLEALSGAKAANASLRAAMACEAATLRLERPALAEDPDVPAEVQQFSDSGEMIVVPNPALVLDQAEREAAAGVLASADPDVLTLVELRKGINTP